MVAYFIALTTLIGKSEMWVRFSGIIVSVILSLLAWNFSKQLQSFADENSDRVASGSVWLINLYPITMAGSIIITPDVPAFLFWSLGIFLIWKIASIGKIYYWYFLGITIGLALLSKYTTVLLIPLMFLFLILTDQTHGGKNKISLCCGCNFFNYFFTCGYMELAK